MIMMIIFIIQCTHSIHGQPDNLSADSGKKGCVGNDIILDDDELMTACCTMNHHQSCSLLTAL